MLNAHSSATFTITIYMHCFQEYEHKIELLLRTCKNIQEDIFETKFLDDVILSLNDKIEKLDHTWPFKIGKSKSGSISNNLIV